MNGKMVVNGELVKEGTISARDRGYTLGDGLFETVSLYNGKPFMLIKHIERMRAGAQIIGMDIPFNERQVAECIKLLSTKAQKEVARLTVTRGEGPRGYGSEGCVEPRWSLTVDRYDPPASPTDGVELHVSHLAKAADNPLYAIKSISALERVVILNEAKKVGAYESLTLTTDRFVSSCASSNLFWVKGGALYTPSLDCSVLPGVTREVVIDIARNIGVKVTEGKFDIYHLQDASEVFITNSLIELTPVKRVRKLVETDGQGLLIKALTEKYNAFTKN